jgi:hypothetical protein
VVCGAGAAGMAAGLAAARAGAEVLLVEDSPRVGGTVADCLIHTIGGLYDDGGELLNLGLPGELAATLSQAHQATAKRKIGRAWVLDCEPEVYREVARRWLAEAGVEVRTGTRVSRVTERGGRVVSAILENETSHKELPVDALVDATGTAEVVRALDPALVRQSMGHMAGGLILRIRGVTPGALAAPRGVAVVRALRTAVAEGVLPTECSHAWLDRGMRQDEVFLKLLVPIPSDWRLREGELLASATVTGERVVAFLRTLAGFTDASVFQVGRLGVREGGRVCGEYVLTAEDVRLCRRFSDPAARCAWPIELWTAGTGVALEYLPPGAWYEIPLRALRVAGLANVWAAGKCLSSEPLAQASARVAGCCWAMGEAVGRAAAE